MPLPLCNLHASVMLGRGSPFMGLSNTKVLNAYYVPGSVLCPVCFYQILSG